MKSKQWNNLATVHSTVINHFSYPQIPPTPDIIGLLFAYQRQMPCFCPKDSAAVLGRTLFVVQRGNTLNYVVVQRREFKNNFPNYIGSIND